MRLLRPHAGRLRLWTIFVLALFVFDALAPALAALAGARQKVHFTVICSVDGPNRIVPLDDPSAPTGSNEFAFQCPLCAGMGATAAIDAPPLPLILLSGLRDERMAGAEPARVAPDTRAPRARGPPSAA